MSLKEKINLVKEQLGISEVDTQALEKALGKKLVDYESVEALVAALMGYYNGELKKKANTSHTHDYAPSSHKHKKADISDFPTSMKNPNALEIKMNGKNPVSYDGSAAKSINITASGIGAEQAFNKNTGFNKNFGTTNGTVLEGSKLAEILGLTYGGSLNTSSAKTVNYAYYDSTTKKVYKCIKATSINYADANYFEAISNNDLLGKLQNYIIETGNNDNGFYIKYANGFIEQFGIKSYLNISSTIAYTINFPINFSTSNYYVNYILELTRDLGVPSTNYILKKTNNSFNLALHTNEHNQINNNPKISWYACGY